MACDKCGARKPVKNGHMWGCPSLRKKADPNRNRKKG